MAKRDDEVKGQADDELVRGVGDEEDDDDFDDEDNLDDEDDENEGTV